MPEKRYVKPGETVLCVMPHSEVCMHMQVAGRVMHAEFRQTKYPDWIAQSVQLFDPKDGRPFSSPIMLGEAGFYRDGEQVYAYVVSEGECVVNGLPMGRK